MEGKEITAKERELGIPWRIASMNEKNCFYVIHGKDYTSNDGREMQILSMQYGYHPIKEHRNRIKANAEIIIEAVNNYTALQSELEKARELLKRHLEQKTAEEEMNYTTDVYAFLNEGKKD